MATPILKSWTPSTTYDFDLRIADKDYSNDLVSVGIRSAVNTPYQNFTLDLYLDATDILIDELYGQNPIKLSIKLMGEVSWPQQTVEFDLLFLNIDAQYTMQRANKAGDQSERVPVRFNAISRKAYTTMTTIVNGFYEQEGAKGIIEDVLSNTEATIEYDTNGRRKYAIEQFLIPPSTIYKTVLYLDRTYGVFEGSLGFHCTYDNRVKVQNLSKKTTSSQYLTIHQLATTTDQSKIINETDPTKFYTKVPVKMFNRGNSVFSVLAPINRFIVKPDSELYKVIEINTEDFIKTYGTIAPNILGNQEIFYDKFAIKTDKRIRYRTNQTGDNSDKTFIQANMAKAIQDMSQIEIELQHNLPILNLMEVGEGVNFLSQISEYRPITGYYVLKASEIGWIRSKTWESFARVYLMRSNISIV
jgi:hypothetical protein